MIRKRNELNHSTLVYSHLIWKYNDYGSVKYMGCAINTKIFSRKSDACHFKYSWEHDSVYISSSIENEMIHLNDKLWDVLAFKWNIINGKSGGAFSRMECYIFADYPPGFSSNNCLFLCTSFVETSRVGKTSVPLLCVLEWTRAKSSYGTCDEAGTAKSSYGMSSSNFLRINIFF